MLYASLIVVWMHALIGGSVERFSNIGGAFVNRTVNSARLPNRRDWRIGQNIFSPSISHPTKYLLYPTSSASPLRPMGSIN